MIENKEKNNNIIKIKTKDKPIFCPDNKLNVWQKHPKIYINIDVKEIKTCPYCGTKYQLID